MLQAFVTGARLHHLKPEEGHALGVWKGGKEEGADQEPGRSLLPAAEGASDQSWGLPRHRQDAGAARQPGLYQVPHNGCQAAREGRQVSEKEYSSEKLIDNVAGCWRRTSLR